MKGLFKGLRFSLRRSLVKGCFLFVMALQCFSTTSLKAVNLATYPTKSLIIPMDSTYQDCGMWPAFGLIYKLLLNDIPVGWAIVQPKTAYDQTDFTVPTSVVLNSPIPTTCATGNTVPSTVPNNYAFTAGPYIIDGTDPVVLAKAINIINAWWAGGAGQSPIVNQPVVIQATSTFIAPVDIVLNTAPIIAIEEINEDIAISYMTAAGIPASTGSPPFTSGWSLIDEADIAAGGLFQSGNICEQRIYDVYVTPHNPGFPYSLTDPTNTGTMAYSQLDNFVYLGGGWIALCFSLQTNEDSTTDLTVNGNAAVKALFKTTVANAGGLLLQQAPKPYQLPSPGFGATCPNAAFPVGSTQNLGSRWVPDATNLGLPISQGMLPTPPVVPTLTTGLVESWTSPYQPIGITPTNNPIYWAATQRISYYDENSTAITDPGNTIRYDSILDGVYHNGTGAGKVSFFAGHWYDNPGNDPGGGPTLPYHTNVAGPYLRAFYNALFLNGNGAVQLQIIVPPTACQGTDIVLDVKNTGSGTATLDSSIVITLASGFTYVSTNPTFPPPDTIVGQVLTWNLGTIPTIPAGATGISINVAVSPSATLGSIQIATLSVQYSDTFGYEYLVNYCTGISVFPIPAMPGAISGPQTPCTGVAATYSITAVPQATSYTWTVPAGWTGLGPQPQAGTSITVTPNLTSGSITVTANTDGGLCASPPATLAVTPVQTPDAAGSISGPTSPCAGSSVIYSVAVVPGATSYIWTLPSGWTGSSTTNSITVTPSGTAGFVTVTPTNGSCPGTSSSLSVTPVTGPVAGPITGPSSPCSGSSVIYSIAAVPGATSYTWTLPAGWTGSSTTNSITVTPSTTSGNVTVIANNGACSGPSSSLPVTPVQTPGAAGAISGSTSPCSGVGTTYSISPVAGATSYTWTVPAGWIISSGQGTDSILVTPTTQSGFVTVTPTNGSCLGTPASLFVTPVQTPGAAGPITGSLSPCSGVATTYSIAAVPGATSYTWTLPAGWTGSSTTDSITVVPSMLSGNVTVTPDNGVCAGASSSLPVTPVNTPGAAGPITGSQTPCTGVATTYSISPVADATSYTWTVPAGWTGLGTQPQAGTSITVTPSIQSGAITVTPNNGVCAGTPASLPVTPIASPVIAPITGPTEVCQGALYIYSTTDIPGATYSWTLPAGWIIIGPTNGSSIEAEATGMSGNITVKAGTGPCNSATQTLGVIVDVIPAQPASISGSATPCAGVSTLYTAAPVAGATSYTWTVPAGWTGLPIQPQVSSSIIVTPSETPGFITVTANTNNGQCSSPPASLQVTPVIMPTIGPIMGPAEVCYGSTNVYFTTLVFGATYNWSVPPGWVIIGSSTGYSITTVALGTSGNITVSADIGAPCPSAPQTFAVIVDSLPAVSINPPAITITKGSSTTLTASGANTYTWSPGALTGSSITVSPAATTTYTVTGVDSHGCSNTASAVVTVVNSVIVANPDSGSVPDGETGGIAVANVLANDTLNGVLSPTLGMVQLTPTSPFDPDVILNPDGSVSVLPGTPGGVYVIGYTICERVNPTNCSSTTVQVTVGVPPIVANPDSGIVYNGIIGGIGVANVLANDTLNGQPATLLNVNLAVVGNPSPHLELDPNTGSVSVLPGTPPGVYMLMYQICDKLNPRNCSTTTVTITVLSDPQPPINPTVCRVKQQFPGRTDIIDVISWSAPPSGSSIVAYRIYKDPNLTQFVGEVANSTPQCATLSYMVPDRKKGQTSVYYIVSVDASGQISAPVRAAL